MKERSLSLITENNAKNNALSIYARNNRLNKPLDCFLAFISFRPSGCKIAAIAASIASSHPSPVLAEHSIYATAPIVFCTFSAYKLLVNWLAQARWWEHMRGTWSRVTGFWELFNKYPIVSESSLRSIFIPTRRTGVLGKWWRTSGIHW